MRCLWLLAIVISGCAGSRTASSTEKAAAAPTADQRATCCAQCEGAARRDPTGADISGKTCTSYPADWNGGVGVDDACRAWFAAQPEPLTVGDCRK